MCRRDWGGLTMALAEASARRNAQSAKWAMCCMRVALLSPKATRDESASGALLLPSYTFVSSVSDQALRCMRRSGSGRVTALRGGSGLVGPLG